MRKNHLAQPLRAPQDLPMANKRPHVLSVTLSAEELAQFQAMAKDADMPMTNMVRGWFREKLAKQAKKLAT
jgi:CheY-specific phosphatase CheX